MKRSAFNLVIKVALTFILAALPVLAQQRQGTGQRSPLAGLERALKDANAASLSEAETNGINSLISAFKQVSPPAGVVQAFESAILACTTCTSFPDGTDEQAITQAMQTNFMNRATFAAQVADILNTGGQMAPLMTKYGTSRTVQLLESLVGGGFGAGRFGAGRGLGAGPQGR